MSDISRNGIIYTKAIKSNSPWMIPEFNCNHCNSKSERTVLPIFAANNEQQ